MGGLGTNPKCAFDIEMGVYCCKMLVPTLVIPGQHDDIILGTNVIKWILHESELHDSYCITFSGPCPTPDPGMECSLSMLSGLSPWRGKDSPDRISTVRCNTAVCLEPGQGVSHLGKIPENTALSPGSAIMTESTRSCSSPRGGLVARIKTD